MWLVLLFFGHVEIKIRRPKNVDFKGKTGYSWGTVPNLKKGTSRKYKRKIV